MDIQKMLSKMRKGVAAYKMISDGDKIAVGVSGGKDSLLLLWLLAEYRRFSPERFELSAISVDLCFDGVETDYTEIQAFCDKLNVPFYIERTQIGQVVFDVRKEKSPCALCSKMRKGALYDVAKKIGANKVALGHHADDLIDTFILSLLYEGRLSTFAPKSYLDRTDLVLIRPMIFIEEMDVKPFTAVLPVKKSCCPANENTKREYAKTLISHIGTEVKNIREMIFTALIHPERYNLFDRFESEIDKF